MPRELNLVPALLHDNREISVMDEGIPEPCVLIGAEDVGIVIVSAKPRIAEVKSSDASSASFSLSASLLLKSTSGCLMYEFHKNPASRLSIDTVAASILPCCIL